MKKKRYEAEGAKEYREANRRNQKTVKKAMENWIGAQCEEIETYLNKTNNKGADQLVKVVIVVLLFYVHGKHLKLCRDGQLT